jgi:hypothetical protein
MACPNCGDDLGTPVTVYSSEWQGDEAHGGRVDYEEESCSLCVMVNKLRDCEQFTNAEIKKIMEDKRAELQAAAEYWPQQDADGPDYLTAHKESING